MTLTGDEEFQDLRRAARDELDDADVEGLRSRIADADIDASNPRSSERVRELLRIETGTDPEHLERPFLTTIPDQYAGRLTLFEWLHFVLGRAGVRRALEAVEYYEKVGWISGGVAEELRDHVRAFRDVAREEETTDLDRTDHVMSLVYVARLASMTDS